MTDMDCFTEQNDLKTTKLQKLWRSPEQRYRYLEDFFVLLMEMIGWCGIYMAVLLYTKRTATEDILGMLTVPFLYGFTYALQRIELLVQRNVDTRTNGAKYQEYTGAIVLIIGHLLEIIFLYGLLGRSAQWQKISLSFICRSFYGIWLFRSNGGGYTESISVIPGNGIWR